MASRQTQLQEVLDTYEGVTEQTVPPEAIEKFMRDGDADWLKRVIRMALVNSMLAARGLAPLDVSVPPPPYVPPPPPSLPPPPPRKKPGRPKKYLSEAEAEEKARAEAQVDISVLRGNYGVICGVSLDKQAYHTVLRHSMRLVKKNKWNALSEDEAAAKGLLMGLIRKTAATRTAAKQRAKSRRDALTAFAAIRRPPALNMLPPCLFAGQQPHQALFSLAGV